MAIPNWSKVTVRYNFGATDDLPVGGKVVFEPQVTGKRLKDAALKQIIYARTLEGSLSTSGTGSVDLYATDDPDVTPINWTYLVTEPNGYQQSVSVPIANVASGMDYADLTTVAASGGTGGGGGGGAVPAASETTAGIVRLATTSEVATGTAVDTAISPARLTGRLAAYATTSSMNTALSNYVQTGTLASYSTTAQMNTAISNSNPTASSTVSGHVRLATALEADGGTLTTVAVTPAELAAYVAAHASTGGTGSVPAATESVSGISRFGTAAEVTAGTLGNVGVSPLRLAGKLSSYTLDADLSERVADIMDATLADGLGITHSYNDTTGQITLTATGGGSSSGPGILFEGRVSVKDYGATGNGTTNDLPALQTAVNAGVPLIVPAGTYRCTSATFTGQAFAGCLGLLANTDLYLAPGAVILKDSSNAGGTTGSFIRNFNFANKCNDLKIHGPGRFRAAAVAGGGVQTGNMFALHGDRMMLRDFTVDAWAGGRCFCMSGDYVRMINVKAYGSASAINNGGIRFFNGKRFVAYGCHVESGDDSYQFVPGDPGGLTQQSDQDIEGCLYIACTGNSTDAKFTVFGLQDGGDHGAPDGVITMQASIRNSGFIGCHGTSQNLAFLCQNISSSGVIENCFITDCSYDMAGAGTTGGPHSNINAFQTTGGVTGLTVNRITIRNPQRTSFNAVRGGEDCTIQGSKFYARAADTTPVIQLGGKNFKFLDNLVDNTRTNMNIDPVQIDLQQLEPRTGPGGGTAGYRAVDGKVTAGSNILVSATAAWTSADVGTNITVQTEGPGTSSLLLQNVIINSVTNATTVVMSKNSTYTNSGNVAGITTYSINPPVNRGVIVRGNHVKGLGATATGFEVSSTRALRIEDNLFHQTAQGAQAFNLTSTATFARVGWNDLSFLTGAIKFTDNSPTGASGTVYTDAALAAQAVSVRTAADVTWPTTPVDGQVLTYDSSTGKLLLEDPQGGGTGSFTPTIANMLAGTVLVIDYYKAVFGAANAWPTSRPTSRTDIDMIWRGPTDPGLIMLAGDIWERVDGA